jgi:hypothetical protein
MQIFCEPVLQILMEADVEGLIGAGRHERSRLLARGAAIRANLPGVPTALPLPCARGA